MDRDPLNRLHQQLAILGVCCLFLVGCLQAGPEVEALEAAVPSIADFDELESGERIEFIQHDSSEDFYGNTSRARYTQNYAPVDGHELVDVYRELVAYLESNGWSIAENMLPQDENKRWCGHKSGQDARVYHASVLLDSEPLRDNPPRVSLRVRLANCS